MKHSPPKFDFSSEPVLFVLDVIDTHKAYGVDFVGYTVPVSGTYVWVYSGGDRVDTAYLEAGNKIYGNVILLARV